MALANDMSDAPITEDTTTVGSGEEEGDQGEEDDPVTQDTITVGRGSEDNDNNNSGQSSDNKGNDDDNENEAATAAKVTNNPDCPEGQEHGLFTTCMPIQSCANQLELGAVAINPPNANNCVNAPVVDHPSTRD